MSEEKITGNTINVNALPSCLDEPIKAVLTPSAKEIGGFFGDLLSIVTGKVHFTAEKRRIQQEHDLQVFKDGLVKKLEEKAHRLFDRATPAGGWPRNGTRCILHGGRSNSGNVPKFDRKRGGFKI